MRPEQIALMIYSYLFNEEARLERAAQESGKYLSEKSDSAYICGYLQSRQRLESFREFSRAIFEILRFYDG